MVVLARVYVCTGDVGNSMEPILHWKDGPQQLQLAMDGRTADTVFNEEFKRTGP
jgi:hypothetical protein